MKPLLIGLAFAAGAAAPLPSSFHSAAEGLGGGVPQAHPALYSFVDVYRLTVAGAMAGVPASDGAPDAVRVASAQPPLAEPRFTVSPLPRPDKWLLILAGLALAGWVAHRRLVHTL
jgi:hypothetical protein